ncbi:MAG: hypothetical protein LN416_07055 [Candidatus Thermoplasmatota archaeon]|nr:hypothetical protein [Candidatus Thermoplasmatota archaeon]
MMPLIDVAVVAIVVVIWLIRPVKDLRYTLITAIVCVVIGGSAVIPISMARKWRFPSLHENGVDDFMVGLMKFAFKRFDEIERVEVFAQGDSARLMFWSTTSSALILQKEEGLKKKVGEIIEFLESKGVKVSLMGKTREWLKV